MDAANLLKPMLARGELRLVGATTLNEYREHVEKDAAFERRFQQVGRVPDGLVRGVGGGELVERHFRQSRSAEADGTDAFTSTPPPIHTQHVAPRHL